MGWFAVVVACGGKSGSDDGFEFFTTDPIQEDTDSFTTTPTEPGTTDTEVPGAPDIRQLTTDVAQITEGESVRVTALVSDPNGVGDVTGGELLAEDGSSYGSFAETEVGTYELIVSWSELDTADPIEFTGTATREMLARFTDRAGLTSQALVSVDLRCEHDAACGGSCVDLTTDPDHCGGCGDTCADVPNVFDATCSASRCMVMTTCDTPTAAEDCTDVCAASGYGPCDDVVLTGSSIVATGIADTESGTCQTAQYALTSCTAAIQTQVGGPTSAVCFCRE
ncbi:MAG: hypothetical protein ABMA64_30105 [Myxococcota bacterium]